MRRAARLVVLYVLHGNQDGDHMGLLATSRHSLTGPFNAIFNACVVGVQLIIHYQGAEAIDINSNISNLHNDCIHV